MAAAVIAALACQLGAQAETPSADDLLKQAAQAASADEAIKLATEAIRLKPDEPASYWFRARVLASQRHHAEAIKDYTRVVELLPDHAEAYYWRGRSRFCAGEVDKAIEDFDRYGELKPEARSQQWERGIALYYAGRFADGAKQFALYQTYHDNDVENATWRYLCMAREAGVDKARAELLPIKNDTRLPMMQIYALYRGELEPSKVLEAAEQVPPGSEQAEERKNQQLFYAHLYLGLYYEAAGEEELARQHVLAAEQHPIGHYMWDVARLHAARLRKTARGE